MWEILFFYSCTVIGVNGGCVHAEITVTETVCLYGENAIEAGLAT